MVYELFMLGWSRPHYFISVKQPDITVEYENLVTDVSSNLTEIPEKRQTEHPKKQSWNKLEPKKGKFVEVRAKKGKITSFLYY